MAKKNGNWKIIAPIVGVIVIGAGLITDFALQGADIKTVAKANIETDKHVAALKKDGCDPAEDVKDRVLVLETNYGHLEAGQMRIEKKMDTQHKDVLEAIKTIKEK